jgi:hypothetical protein
LPNIRWLGSNGKYGLAGWNDRIAVPGIPGKERMIIHAYLLGGLVGTNSRRGEHIMPPTISDKEIHFYASNHQNMVRDFSI